MEAMTGLIQNLAEVGCDYVERARKSVPLLNHAIESMEPYLVPVVQVAELYIDAAFSAISPEHRPPEQKQVESPKLTRVMRTVDLLQLRQSEKQSPQDQSLFHQARLAGTKLLNRVESFVDTLGPSEAGLDDARGLRQLGGCPSECSESCSDSFISSLSDTESSDTDSELCLTTVEMIPRALLLPVVLQVQVARLLVGKASGFACSTASMGCSLLQRGTFHFVRRTLQVASYFALCRRAGCLVDGYLGNAPGVRRVIVLALANDDGSECSTRNEGGTGCCTN